MKRLLLLILSVSLTFLLGACGSGVYKENTTLNVMSFNIRLDTPSDSLSNWSYRKNNVTHLISYYAPDVLGMQEVLSNQLKDLLKVLPKYNYVGVGRDDGEEAGEYCPIFYDSKRFELLDKGNFSLSEEPDSFGTLAWDAACNRICTWAILYNKADGTLLACFNTHLDHVGVQAREEGTRLIVSKIEEIAGTLPTVLMGDFNSTQDDEPALMLKAKSMYSAFDRAEIMYGPNWSFHDFGKLQEEDRPLIDYVYVSEKIKVSRCRIIQDTPQNGYYSDHNPVMAEISVNN